MSIAQVTGWEITIFEDRYITPVQPATALTSYFTHTHTHTHTNGFTSHIMYKNTCTQEQQQSKVQTVQPCMTENFVCVCVWTQDKWQKSLELCKRHFHSSQTKTVALLCLDFICIKVNNVCTITIRKFCQLSPIAFSFI